MSSDRWREVSRLYHAAIAQPPEARVAFLTEACTDDTVRQEVQALLAQHVSAPGFLEPGAFGAAVLALGDAATLTGSIGPYEIQGLLGAGGMGEVYRGRDPRLGRDVAIKILPREFINDADRLARFEREARILAALNHPNIGAIYGLEDGPAGDDGPSRALILELVEGETLEDRLARGPVTFHDALTIATQVGEALEAAHEKGIVHRDLKPANIKITPGGVVKVLDFGLAKLTSDRVPGKEMAGPTRDGLIVGTVAYMSPEQLRGRDVDIRSDIWTFGCVLYEMLVGRSAFTGATATDTLAAIVEREPDWNALPPSTPRSVRRLVRRCLAKDRRERLQAIGDALLEITDALTPRTDDEPPVASASHTSHANRIVPFAAVAGTALVVGISTWTLKPPSPVAERLVARSLIAVEPFDQRPPASAKETRPPVGRPDRTAVAVSPDGRTLVFWGVGRSGPQLFLRPLDRLEAVPIPGTEGAQSPFFSPDGVWIGFWAKGELRRVPAAGGPPSIVTRVPGVGTPTIEGASWGDGDRIVFATREGLWRVPASGGSPEAVSKRGAGEYAHKLPHVLPGGREALFTLQRTSSRWDDAQIVVRSLVTGEQKVLVDDGADARYVPSGHLVFIRRGTLMAIPFDLARLVSTGAPVAMIDGVMQAANNVNTVADSGAGQYAIAEQGRLIYVTGGITPDDERALVWVHRNGTVEPIAGAPHREYIAPRLAPDGRRIVVVTQTSASGDGQRVWIYDMARHTLTPLTSKKERSLWGVWSPDGAQIAFQTILAGRNTLSWKSADGAGTSETLRASEQSYPAPSSWSRDGKIAFVEGSPTKANDILVLDTRATDRRAQPVVQTPAGEYHPAFSPDGNWLAYTSNESGQPEVYVQPYPGPGPRVLVSTNGGEAPAWRGDGAELYYHYHTFNITPADGVLVMNAVPVTATAPRFSVGTPRRLFEGRYLAAFPARGYDVTLDGRRFLMTQMIEPPSPPRSDLVLVENWLEELRRRVR